MAYLGESSNLSLLVQDRHGTVDVVHYPLPENIKGPRAKVSELDSVEIDILHQRGAFLLPPRALCDEVRRAGLIDCVLSADPSTSLWMLISLESHL